MICFDARMLWHGGVGTYIRNLLPYLKESFTSLKVIVHPKMEKWVRDYDVILSSAPIYSCREQVELFFRIPKVDLFFSPHYNVPLTWIRAKKRVVTIHDVFHLAHASQFRLHQRLYAKCMIHQAVHRSDLIFTDSQFSLSEICKYTKISEERIHPIACGVDRQVFSREKNQKKIQEVIDRHLLPSRYFLFVGNAKPHKNLQGLLLAMREMEGVKLVVVGKTVGDDLEGKVRRISSVTNEELSVFYQLAEALIYPSYYEGFGLPPLEAMSCGCAVIVSKEASLPEVCGSAALYVSPSQPKEIALAMQKIMKDLKLKQKLQEAGNEHVERFSWKKCAARHIELLQRKLS